MVSVFIVDATFVTDPTKFISGSLLALSAMISMQLPHVNVLSKCDLVEEASMERVLEMESALQLWDVLGPGSSSDGIGGALSCSSSSLQHYNHLQPSTATAKSTATESSTDTEQNKSQARERKWHRLTEAICSLLDDYSMVGFVPLNINDEDSISHVLATVDHSINYGEDLEVRGADYDDGVADEDD